MAELPHSSQVVVVGAGIMGTSTAYHAATLGADVVLIERDTIASGSTSKAAGGFRSQFSDELNVAMAVENVRRLERFDEEFGTDIDFKQWGYLMLLQDEDMGGFGAALEVQQRHGVQSQMLTPAQAAELVPGIEPDGLAGATWCPTDGYCTPEAVAQGYATASARAGATIVQGCEVQELVVEAGRVVAVATDRGTVSAERVVLTAGVWSKSLGAQVGLDLPIEAVKRYVWLTDGPDRFPERLPLVIDFSTGFYFHREGQGLLFGGRESTLEAMAPAVERRAPALLDLPIRPGWWGYYEISPDHNALVGEASNVSGLFYATGFSGHGFQQGPVVGEHLAQRALDLDTAFDLSALDVERFAAGQTVPEGHFV